MAFDFYAAVKWSRLGESVILVRSGTNPDDLNVMIATDQRRRTFIGARDARR